MRARFAPSSAWRQARRRAATVLKGFDGPATEALIRALHGDPASEVRARAALALEARARRRRESYGRS